MRIIAGSARGRLLNLPKGCAVRPTADMVKEALFSMLRSVEGLSFLDLFAGSGGVGIEALSRGALKAVFIERDKVLARAIEENIGKCGFADLSEILAVDVLQGIDAVAKRGEQFDIIFSDPPYDTGAVSGTLASLAGSGLMTKNSLIVIQHSLREAIEGIDTMQIVLTDQRRYGDTYLSFLTLPI